VGAGQFLGNLVSALPGGNTRSGALHENKKNNLVVLGVAMDYRDPKTVLQFSDQMMVTYPIILGDQKMAAQVGTIPGLPTTYLYNPQGKVVAYNVGALTREAVERYIRPKNKGDHRCVGCCLFLPFRPAAGTGRSARSADALLHVEDGRFQG
jgi:hypothetical protein